LNAPAFSHYQLQVDDDPAFASPEVDNTSINDKATIQLESPVALATNTKFYWRVRAVNTSDETGNWSAVRYFRTALTPPTLVSPNEANHLLTLRPTFDWDDVPGATGYTIQISTNGTTFASPTTGSPASSNFTPTADLKRGAPLYWRVQTKGTNGPSAWSEVRSFTSPNPPSTPSLSLPAANALTTDYTPLFKWSVVTIPLNAPAFSHYQLQVDNDPAFASPEVDDTSINDKATIQLESPVALATNTKFYWRVRAVNTSNETGNWSAVRYFRTAQ
jgi:hypothetical protein